jgi:hypothetical protein
MSYLNADVATFLEVVAKESPEAAVSAVEAAESSEMIFAITQLDEDIKKTFTEEQKDRVIIALFKQHLHHGKPYAAVALAAVLDLNTSQMSQLLKVVVNSDKPFTAFKFARDVDINDQQKQRLVDYLLETDHGDSAEAAIRFFERLDVTEKQEKRLREKVDY